mmetsp:Transcript_9524/g.11427  ORF Transcript_9524/g.11427 Transcript_9524/m.11427 type:complete len:114 (+) Transcript_9524:761-1102(+)
MSYASARGLNSAQFSLQFRSKRKNKVKGSLARNGKYHYVHDKSSPAKKKRLGRHWRWRIIGSRVSGERENLHRLLAEIARTFGDLASIGFWTETKKFLIYLKELYLCLDTLSI